MQTQGKFVDYYDLLQISPKAELETIRRVYKMLVARLHPDNADTAMRNSSWFSSGHLRFSRMRNAERNTMLNTPRA
jgi:curved DNA-binding protein CbpA